VQEIEPHVRCVAGIKVPSTGIVNYRDVSAKYVELIKSNGGTVQSCTRVDRFREANGIQVIETPHGEFEAGFIINCAGLFSDRVTRFSGLEPSAKIVPYRGEYYKLLPERRYLVRSLVYPVPSPDFPFLGVHFTRMIDDSIHAGPNAVLAFKRQGYPKTDINCADLFETITFPGFWKLARKHHRQGMMEMMRSVSKRAFVKSLQQLIPEITEDDLVPTNSGVRAQALMPNGKLVDHFLIVKGKIPFTYAMHPRQQRRPHLKSDALLRITSPRSRQLGGEILISGHDNSNARWFWARTLIAGFVAFILPINKLVE
jgi:L-2-hydroxyglutarate oxidase